MTIITQHHNNRPRPRAVYRKHRPTMTENNASRYLIHATHLFLSILIDHPCLLGEGTRRNANLFLSVIVIVIDLTHARAYAHTIHTIRYARNRPGGCEFSILYSRYLTLPRYHSHITLSDLANGDPARSVEQLGLFTAFKGARS